MNMIKFIKLYCLFVVLIITSSLSAQSVNSTDSIKLLQEFMRQTVKWQEAYNSKDAQNLSPLYSEDAQYISSHVAGLVANGRQNLIAYFQKGIDMGGHIDTVQVLSMNVSCDLATLLCKYQATNNGEVAIGRNLLVLRKINESWLIILHMTVV
jgi:ketosteroid isomerase-like protein